MFFEKLKVYEEKIAEKKQRKSGVFDETACVCCEWRVEFFRSV